MLAVLGVPLVVVGVLAYAGVWRSWAGGGRHRYLFGLGWIGLGFCVIALAPAMPRGVAGIVGTAGVVLVLIGALNLFWAPAVLTPRWFREERRTDSGIRY